MEGLSETKGVAAFCLCLGHNDIMVVFIETALENWAFAGGIQYYVEGEDSN